MPPEATPKITPIFARLDDSPISAQARALVVAVVGEIEGLERLRERRKNQRLGAMAEKFHKVVGAFVADLVRAAGRPESGGWVYRSTQASSFTGELVTTRRRFEDAYEPLRDLGYVERVSGGLFGLRGRHGDDTDEPIEIEDDEQGAERRRASHFRATEALIRLAQGHGVEPSEYDDHFVQNLPFRVVELRAAATKDWGEKTRGKLLLVKKGSDLERLRDRVAAMEADLHRLNKFIDGFRLTGGKHRGFVRIFNLADQPEFDLNKGGRLYSRCEGSYQGLPEGLRVAMTIDGEPVVEMDIKASYLTILHSLKGLPFDPTVQDPYQADDLPLRHSEAGKDLRRWTVKSWVVATLGARRHHGKWPDQIVKDYTALGGGDLTTDYPIKVVREAMAERHPILATWSSSGVTWADLMFLESEAVFRTMMSLMDEHSVPSLAVHDSLIVRKRDEQVARGLLRDNYLQVCGAVPCIE